MAIDDNGTISYEPSTEFEQIPASKSTFAAVKRGMQAVVNATAVPPPMFSRIFPLRLPVDRNFRNRIWQHPHQRIVCVLCAL